MLLGIDVGTTHCKAGLFRPDGTAVEIVSRPTTARRAPEGWAYFEPNELFNTVVSAMAQAAAASREPIAAIGVASMAETGLLLDRGSGQPRSPLIPWFETAADPQGEFIRGHADPIERFARTGIRASFKCSLAKILWLAERQPGIADDAVWLCAADYIAYRLTGEMATDYSLATRTYAFRLDTRRWDDVWLRSFGLNAELFPEAYLGSTVVGQVGQAPATAAGITAGIPVTVAGHDHICAALAVGATRPGVVFDSMGTAEALLGALRQPALGERQYHSGLVYGCHVVEGMDYWMGGLSASGRSVEWLRGILGEPHLDYDALLSLLERPQDGPTGILYFPYLLGNQSRAPEADARGAFIGLTDKHTRADLAQAVLEGTAMEMETVRETAEAMNGLRIKRLIAAGGGLRNSRWLQIKADLSGCAIEISPVTEATLLGAAILGGVGAGVYASAAEGAAAAARPAQQVFEPDAKRHARYRQVYEQQYLAYQEMINRPSPGHSDSTKGKVMATRLTNVLTLNEILPLAGAGGYAVGAFSPRLTPLIAPVLAVGQKLCSPLIVQISEKELTRAGITPEEFATEFYNQLNQQHITVPVVLHLDHTKELAVIHKAIAAGFTSVMIDASDKLLEDNIAETRKVVEYAHARGVSVEGELGRIGTTDFAETDEDVQGFTDPQQARRMVQESGVDALAVSVGTAHGLYTSRRPRIDYARLAAIRAQTPVPLVLHGGSDVPVEMIRRAITLPSGSVSKINIATDLEVAMLKAIGRERRLTNAECKALTPQDLARAQAAVEAAVSDKIVNFLGSQDRECEWK